MIYLSDGVNRGFSPVPAVGRRCIFTALSTNISLSEKVSAVSFYSLKERFLLSLIYYT